MYDKQSFRASALNIVLLSLALAIYLFWREKFGPAEAFYRMFFENPNQTVGFLFVAAWTASSALFITTYVNEASSGMRRILGIVGVVYVWFAVSAAVSSSALNTFTNGHHDDMLLFIFNSVGSSVVLLATQWLIPEHLILLACTTLLVEFVGNRIASANQ